MTDPAPNDYYGSNTIEGAFLDDIESLREDESQSIAISTDCGTDTVDYVAHELDKQPEGTTEYGGETTPIVSMVHRIGVPSSIPVTDGANVAVTGEQWTWVFTDVAVRNDGQYMFLVESEEVRKL